MKNRFRKSISLFLIGCLLFFISGCLRLREKSNENITTGNWKENVFTNVWSDISFTMPSSFESVDVKELGAPIPGHVYDFFVNDENQKSGITLYYVDLTYGQQQNLSLEDYLNEVKSGLLNSPNKDYIFANGFSSAVIAGEDYLVLRSNYSFKGSAEKETYYQDGYARKIDDAMIIFLTVYSEETKETIDLFLSSISKAN